MYCIVSDYSPTNECLYFLCNHTGVYIVICTVCLENGRFGREKKVDIDPEDQKGRAGYNAKKLLRRFVGQVQ